MNIESPALSDGQRHRAVIRVVNEAKSEQTMRLHDDAIWNELGL